MTGHVTGHVAGHVTPCLLGTNVERTMEGVPVADTFHLPPEFHEGSNTSHILTPLTRSFTVNYSLNSLCCSGLQLCRWAGRNQIVRHRGVTYFLDGAHTPDSVKVRGIIVSWSDNV